MKLARTTLLMASLLGLSSLLMEWWTLDGILASHVVAAQLAGSVRGIDYGGWPLVALGSASIGGLALGLGIWSRRAVIIACSISASLLLGLGLVLLGETEQRTTERAFFVTLNHFAADAGVKGGVVREAYRDAQGQTVLPEGTTSRASPGVLAPIISGAAGLIGVVLAWRATRPSLTPDAEQDVAMKVGDTVTTAILAASLATASGFMVWVSYPLVQVELFFIGLAFTGIELLQWPLLLGGSLLAAIGVTVLIRQKHVLARSLLKIAAVAWMAVSVSTFFTAGRDTIDESIPSPFGPDHELTLLSASGDLPGRLPSPEFEAGSLLPLAAGVALLVRVRAETASTKS